MYMAKTNLCAYAPEKPAHIGWMSAQGVDTMCYQLMVLLLAVLYIVVEVGGRSDHAQFADNLPTDNQR